MRTRLTPLLLSLAVAAGCDDGSTADTPRPADLTVDQAVAARDQGVADAEPDAAGPDLGAADADVADADPDAADADPDAAPAECAQAATARESGLQLSGCEWVRDGLAAPPRGVVLATDSLERAARTPRHEAEHLQQLAEAGADTVFILVMWEGIEPRPQTFNGAYMGRICALAEASAAAGLEVVLTVYHDRFGVGAGGLGAPAWAGEGWGAFLDDEGRAFQPAWTRLLETCSGQAVAGVGFVGLPAEPKAQVVAYMSWAEGDAEARFGPLVSYWPAEHVGQPRAADRVPLRLAGAAPGAAALPDLAGAGVAVTGGQGAEALGQALAAAGAAGWTPVVWADGFGGPLSLRDQQGLPGPAFSAAFDSPWPAAVAGSLRGWGATPEGGWAATWAPDQRNEGVSRFAVFGPAPALTEVQAEPPVEAFAAYDPVAREITVYVAPGAQRATLTLSWEGE